MSSSGASDSDPKAEASSSGATRGVPPPLNQLVNPMLTDLYQVTMSYGYWKALRHEERSVFELFFRKCPFKGEFAVFAGLDQILAFLSAFKFTPEDIAYLQSIPSFEGAEQGFFDYLLQLDCSKVKVRAVMEGTVVFPRTPLVQIEGPLLVAQLLETTILNLVNFPSLIATNAMRMRLAAGDDKTLLEFGLRRAQGPDGAVSASRYSYIGGFDGTSNVLAGQLAANAGDSLFISGTHAHSFVQSYHYLSQLDDPAPLIDGVNLRERSLEIRRRGAEGKNPEWANTNEGELAAFIAYAWSFPSTFLALVDTYNTIESGVPNFIIVSIALHSIGGRQCKGIRLDSGDLAYLSKRARAMIQQAAADYDCPTLLKAQIVASNDINEQVLRSLNEQGHEIDAFGIGTQLVTCASNPALGCVYKLAQIGTEPCMKLSNEVEKVMIPYKKQVYRLLSTEGKPILDLLSIDDESLEHINDPAPKENVPALCRHPFVESKRARVTPTTVMPLLQPVWDMDKGCVCQYPKLGVARAYAMAQVRALRPDTIRHLNPTPYKVSVSEAVYAEMHKLWLSVMPVTELK